MTVKWKKKKNQSLLKAQPTVKNLAPLRRSSLRTHFVNCMDRQDYPKSSLLFENKLKKEEIFWSQRRKLSPKLFSCLFLSCCEQPKKVLKRLGKTSNNCFCFHPKVIHSESPSHQRANSNWVTQMEASLQLVW